MGKVKQKKWKRAGFSIQLNIIQALDSIPRNIIPNKSKLIESLIVTWLYDNNYAASGSL